MPGNLLSGLGHALSCTLLPAECSLCGTLLSDLSETPICAACWSEVALQRVNCCARCGEDLFEPVSSSRPKQECRACRLVPPHFVSAVSYGVYEGAMRSAIHALKFEGMTPAAKELGRRMGLAIASMANDAPREMLVVPVPLHRGRMKQRRYNQARTLATEALRTLAKSHPDWKLEISADKLVRQRATESQAGLTPRQRRQNLRGAFFVPDAEGIRGRHVLLIDDIYTTGATARVCSQVLVEAGAASVRIATLARAQRRVPVRIREDRKYIRLEVAPVESGLRVEALRLQ